MMNYETQYNFLRDEMEESLNKFLASGSGAKEADDYLEKRNVFQEFCTDILEKLLEENQDILKRLK